MTRQHDGQDGDGQPEMFGSPDPLSSLQRLSSLEYYGTSESAIIAGVRLAAQRRGLVSPGGSDGSWPMDWLDFEARPELAASSLDTVDVGCRRVCGFGFDELVSQREQRGAGLEPADYRVLLYVGGLPEPPASLPAAQRAWESRLSTGFRDGTPNSRTSTDCLLLVRAALTARSHDRSTQS